VESHLSYIVWDENKQENQMPPKAKVICSQGPLFVRKLVDSTLIHNSLYLHLSNETDRNGSSTYIYLGAWDDQKVTHGAQIKNSIFQSYEVGTEQEHLLLFYILEGSAFVLKHRQHYSNAFDLAQVLLDHYHTVGESHYEVMHACLDHESRKVLLFLTHSEFQE